MKQLPKLKALYYENAGLSDISGLTGLMNLETLNLRGNQIIDVRPLANFNQLQYLDLSYNKKIESIVTLKDLTSMRYLYLDDNQISDLSPLIDLVNLTYLSLAQNQISDIRPLSGLSNLENLILYRNQISDVRPLMGLTVLKHLNLSDNQINASSTEFKLLRAALSECEISL